MGIEEILQNQVLVSISLLVIGAVITLVFTKFSNKTGVFRYIASSTKVGISADDEIFGTVRTTWQGNQVRNLYLFTFELENSTTKDYENIEFRVYSGNETIILNQHTSVLDSPNIVPWKKSFEEKIHVPEGQTITDDQLNYYNHNREYDLQVFNRGQKISLSYLCTNPNNDNEPSIFISTSSKGVKLKKQNLPYLVLNPIFGVPVPVAISRALILSVLVILVVGFWVESIWAAAAVCMIFGLSGQVFGAVAYKIERFILNIVSG